MGDVRVGTQLEAEQAWIDAGRSGTIVIGTGGGKTKVAIDLINQLEPKLILILVDRIALVESWQTELAKYLRVFDPQVIIETYQSAHKWDDKIFEMVIYDEVDAAATPVYQRVFKEECIKSICKLGLTGFIPEGKEEFFQTNLPVVYQKEVQVMQDEGVLNEAEVIFVEYPLLTTRTIKVPKKAGGFFMTSENDQYVYYDKVFRKALAIKSSLEKQARLVPGAVTPEELNSADWNMKRAATKRKSILNNLDSSIIVVKNLCRHILEKNDNKVLIFSAITAQADRFGVPTFHGKDTSTEKDLSRLNEGKIRSLAVCKAIERGVNLVGVNYLIKESFDGSETAFHQSYGRLMRLKPGEVAKYIILIPYFEDRIREEGAYGYKIEYYNTQQGRWAEKMLATFDYTKARTIRLSGSLVLKDGIDL